MAKIRSEEDPLGFPIREMVIPYVMTVVLAFGREACELGRPTLLPRLSGDSLWSIDRIQAETLGFLEKFAVASIREKGGDQLQRTTGGSQISSSLRFALLNTPTWEKFEELCMEIAELQANPPVPPLFGIYRSGGVIEPSIAPPPITLLVEPPPIKKRAPSSITNLPAATRMQDYIESKGMRQNDFATLANTTPRTLYEFRTTGKVRIGTFKDIATAMGISFEDLNSTGK